MSGRAGRDGNPACAVLLTNKAEVKACKDKALIEVVVSKENCRRKILLKGLNSEEILPHVTHCCDACGHQPIQDLSFIVPIRSKRTPKVKPVRKVPDQTIEILKRRLLAERQHMIDGCGQVKALGGVLICPMSCVIEVCKRVDYIKELDDILNIPGLRTQFATRFFDIFTEVLAL